MHMCDVSPHGGEGECGRPATKCVQLIDYFTNGEEDFVDCDIVWLCDEHFNDPEFRAAMEESFDEVRY
jgi:hypothetical protein